MNRVAQYGIEQMQYGNEELQQAREVPKTLEPLQRALLAGGKSVEHLEALSARRSRGTAPSCA